MPEPSSTVDAGTSHVGADGGGISDEPMAVGGLAWWLLRLFLTVDGVLSCWFAGVLAREMATVKTPTPMPWSTGALSSFHDEKIRPS